MDARIGKWFKVDWRGTERVAVVKACRVDPESPTAGSHIYYCHFHGTDSRLDSWIPASKILCEVNQPVAPQIEASAADSPSWSDNLSKKRKRDADLPTAGYSSASNPTTALQPRTISTVYFGDYRMKAWYHSPYPIEDLLREMPLNKAKASTPALAQKAATASTSTHSSASKSTKGAVKSSVQPAPTAQAQTRAQRPLRKAAANAVSQSEQLAQGRTATRASKRLSGASNSVEPSAISPSAQSMPAMTSATSSRSSTPATHPPNVASTASPAASTSANAAVTTSNNASIEGSRSIAVPQTQSGVPKETLTDSPLRLKGGGSSRRRRHKSSSPTPPRLTPPPDRSDWSFVNPNNGRLMKPFNPFGDTTDEGSSSETEEEDFKPDENQINGSAALPASQADLRAYGQAGAAASSSAPVQVAEAPKASTSTLTEQEPPRQAATANMVAAAALPAKKKQEPLTTDATLYVCEACFKYFVHDASYVQHRAACKYKAPPGDEIYNSTVHSMWEVDGAKAKLYCQNLCLFGKLFIDHKYVFFDTAPFLFYIMTERRPGFNHVLGFFSKEKVSYNDYNLACIVTIPPYQKNGFGRFMIEFSYEISAQQSNSRRAGTPERPLSDLGLRTYLQFWTAVLVRWFRLIFFTRTDPRFAATFTATATDRKLKSTYREQLKSQSETGVNKELGLPNGATTKGDTIVSKDPKGNHFQTRFSIAEIANATKLREDDVAFALVHSGLAKFRAPAPEKSDGTMGDTIRVEGATDDELELVIAPGLVEDVAKRFKVSDPFIRYNGFKKPNFVLPEPVSSSTTKPIQTAPPFPPK